MKQECYEDAAAVFTVTTKSPSYKGWTVVTSRRDNDDGTATMVAELKRPGLVILVK